MTLGYTLPELLRTYRWAVAHPEGRIMLGRIDSATGAEWLRWFRGQLDKKVSSRCWWYGVGRKWDWQWQVEAQRTARAVNTPRLVVRWVPKEFRERLAHRIEWE